MVYCLDCGIETNLGQKYCIECGTSLQSSNPAKPTATIHTSHVAPPSAPEHTPITGTNNPIREQSSICAFSLVLSLLSLSSFIYFANYPALLPLLFIAIATGIVCTYTSYDKRQELMKGLETNKNPI